jgi:hypothetical protein
MNMPIVEEDQSHRAANQFADDDYEIAAKTHKAFTQHIVEVQKLVAAVPVSERSDGRYNALPPAERDAADYLIATALYRGDAHLDEKKIKGHADKIHDLRKQLSGAPELLRTVSVKFKATDEPERY